MTATIKTPIGEATIDNYKWVSTNKVLEEYLNFMLDPDGAGGEDPDPDLTAAMEAVERLPDAELVAHDKPDFTYQPGVIY